jgi:diguanylate cyclase (GGDEF)-like protein
MLRFFRRSSERFAPYSYHVDPSLVNFGNQMLIRMGQFVLRPSDEKSHQFLSEIQRGHMTFPAIAGNESSVEELTDRISETIDVFSEYQRESVETLIAELGSAVSDAIATLHDAETGTSDVTQDLQIVRDQVVRVTEAETFDEAKQLLARGVETLAGVLSRQVEREERLHNSFAACNKRLEEQLKQAQKESRTDALTKLANRAGFDQHAYHTMMWSSQSRNITSLALIDLDGFKAVNDTYGHAAGDCALTTFAQRLASATGNGAFLARIGGDEFAVIYQGKAKHLIGMLHTLEQSLAKRPVIFGKNVLEFGMSYGVTEFNERQTLDELMASADQMLYANKRAKRSEAA